MDWKLPLRESFRPTVPTRITSFHAPPEAAFWYSLMAPAYGAPAAPGPMPRIPVRMVGQREVAELYRNAVCACEMRLDVWFEALSPGESNRLKVWSHLVFRPVWTDLVFLSRAAGHAAVARALARLLDAWPWHGKLLAFGGGFELGRVFLQPRCGEQGAVTGERAKAVVWTAWLRVLQGHDPHEAIRRALARPLPASPRLPMVALDSAETPWLVGEAAFLPEYVWLASPELARLWWQDRLLDGFRVRLALRTRNTWWLPHTSRQVRLIGPAGRKERWLWIGRLRLNASTLDGQVKPIGSVGWLDAHRVLRAWPEGYKALFAWQPDDLHMPPLTLAEDGRNLEVAIRLRDMGTEQVRAAFEAAAGLARRGASADDLRRWIASRRPEHARALSVLRTLAD
ncbi:MAG TPA: hypothetical protein VIK99_06405 [Thermaerobacter sp.]